MDLDEKYTKKMAHERRIRQQALAILRRGKHAGIPDRYLRTNRESFKELLCNSYHSDVDKITNLVFDDSDKLLTISNILIDGGNDSIRTQVGCTILFRMIACDKSGMYLRCDRLSHKLEDMKSDGTVSRNVYLDNIQGYDALFIGEVKATSFNEHLASNSFVDELLGYRIDKTLPTIFSFTKPLCQANEITNKVAGDLLSSLSIREKAAIDSDENPTKNFLRIRVKNV